MTASLILYLLLGLVLGAAYFALMWRGLRLRMASLPLTWVALQFVLRFVAAGLVFWLVARAGAWPLLATFTGFLLARFGAARLVRGGG